MKKFLTLKALPLILVFVSTWSIPARAADPVTPPSSTSPLGIGASRQQLVGEVWSRTELYFGSEKPDGSEVTQREFRKFVDEQVTPYFPDGLTVLTGYGQFRNAAGVIVKEQARVLILFYPLKTKNANKNIQTIRDAYKCYFQQESVLRVDSLALISF